MDSSGKGKGKAKAVDNTSPDGLDGFLSNTSAEFGSTDNSAASRIQQSAIELARAILSAGPESFAMEAHMADKPRDGASTNAGPSSLERGETSQARSAQTSAPGSSAARFSQTPGVDQQAAADYDLFLQEATTLPSLLSPAEYGGRPDQATHVTAGQHETAIQEQEARDGAEVLNLLASPDILDLTEDPNIDPDLSPEDVDMLRKALFEGPSQRGTANWDSLLNLAPDFLLAGDPEATRQHLGVSDNAEGIKQWLDQWRDVLDQYTDEVWGDLGPLAQDARREVDQAEKQQEQQPTAGQQGNLKALGRLRQILAHVRGP
ncbi:hypothetical protein F5X68DRAFT_209645 [Plectosphaerella plurivora]|uniref:Uncharacterized protein n=1 Tax=Plectosphaerella plurivora TaxID=936078 RepID=A0A9P9AAE6_9PEZI|nr:hypothetical protein F5X68DRAFT_209645 [Plectosphaerella plurivora]